MNHVVKRTGAHGRIDLRERTLAVHRHIGRAAGCAARRACAPERCVAMPCAAAANPESNSPLGITADPNRFDPFLLRRVFTLSCHLPYKSNHART